MPVILAAVEVRAISHCLVKLVILSVGPLPVERLTETESGTPRQDCWSSSLKALSMEVLKAIEGSTKCCVPLFHGQLNLKLPIDKHIFQFLHVLIEHPADVS